jgi:hypothetical protein
VFSETYHAQWRENPYYVDVDSIVDMISVLIEKQCWYGTPSELLTALHSMKPGASLPPTAHQLASLLEMLASVLADRVFIDCNPPNADRWIALHRVPNDDEKSLTGEGELTSAVVPVEN